MKRRHPSLILLPLALLALTALGSEPVSTTEAWLLLSRWDRFVDAQHQDFVGTVSDRGTHDELVKITLEGAVNAVEEAMRQIEPVVMPAECVNVQKTFALYLERMRTFYQAGPKGETGEAIARHWQLTQKAHEAYKTAADATFAEFQADFKASGMGKMDAAPEIKAAFAQALKMYDAGNTADAFGLLELLAEKTAGTAAEHHCLVKMADCWLHSDHFANMMEQGDADLVSGDEGLKYLTRVVESKFYSPVLAEAFLRWRVTEQSKRGDSNYAVIPNHYYNKIRTELIEVIQAHIAKHPADAWAQQQLTNLVLADNIKRGLGISNTNVHWWGLFFAGENGEE
jgi:hypothetical protein